MDFVPYNKEVKNFKWTQAYICGSVQKKHPAQGHI